MNRNLRPDTNPPRLYNFEGQVNIPLNVTLPTKTKPIQLVYANLSYDNFLDHAEDGTDTMSFDGLLKVHFENWDININGYVHDDDIFKAALEAHFNRQNIRPNIQYEESGMQEDEYIAFWVGSEFVEDAVRSAFDQYREIHRIRQNVILMRLASKHDRHSDFGRIPRDLTKEIMHRLPYQQVKKK